VIKHFVIFGMGTALVTGSIALAATESPSDYEKSGAPTAPESTTADRPPVATLPEAHAPETTRAPISETNGQGRLRWTQATAIGIPLRSPLQPPSVSTVVARKAEQEAPAGVEAPQPQVWRWLNP
jgi:hypothetical protein